MTRINYWGVEIEILSANTHARWRSATPEETIIALIKAVYDLKKEIAELRKDQLSESDDV